MPVISDADQQAGADLAGVSAACSIVDLPNHPGYLAWRQENIKDDPIRQARGRAQGLGTADAVEDLRYRVGTHVELR
jgi:hypothetical protein